MILVFERIGNHEEKGRKMHPVLTKLVFERIGINEEKGRKMHQIFYPCCVLTLYQTDFGQVIIKSICRQNNKCNLKMEILCRIGRKDCGKRRKCWFPAFSPFPTMYS